MQPRLIETLSERRGVAVVLATLAVAFIAAITLQLNLSVITRMQAAASLRDGVAMDAMLRSGLNVARAALFADQAANQHDSPHDEWKSGTIEDLSAFFDEDVQLRIQVEDLSGGLPINGLAGERQAHNDKEKQDQGKTGQALRQVWLNLLNSGVYVVENEEQAAELLDTLMDWLDKNDDERDHGAEGGYYQGLKPSYHCRNGALRLLEELGLVKGWTKELLHGDKEHPGILGLVDVYGESGKININTAPAEVLKALANIDDQMIAKLIEFREDEANKDALANTDWYHLVLPGDIELPKELISVTSTHFRITVSAAMGDYRRNASGILHRAEDQKQTLLSWVVE